MQGAHPVVRGRRVSTAPLASHRPLGTHNIGDETAAQHRDTRDTGTARLECATSSCEQAANRPKGRATGSALKASGAVPRTPPPAADVAELDRREALGRASGSGRARVS